MKNTFLGVRMAQSEQAIPAWESVFRKYQPKQLLEIGTYRGGFALYLKCYCSTIDAEFHTVDIKDLRQTKLIDDCFKVADCFEIKDEIKEFIKRPGCSILFCDGGNKELEFNTFVDYLKTGDVIAVHDWGTEVHQENLKLAGLSMVNRTDTMTRFFIKT